MVWEVTNPDIIKDLLANANYEQIILNDEAKKESKSKKKTEVS